MPRTQKRWLADQGMPDGQIFVSMGAGDVTSGTGGVITRISAGKFALSLPTAATAYIMDKNSSYVLGRTGMNDDLQEAFGGSNSTFTSGSDFPGARGQASPPATFSTPAGVTGPPPFTGITQLTPVTAARPKGLSINSVSAIYTISGAAASVNSIAIYGVGYANNVAPAVSTILASTNLSTAVQTNPYVTTVTVNSGYLTTLNADYVIEWSLTTGASTGAALIYGLIFSVTYNYQ
jgi:hypothetical protein